MKTKIALFLLLLSPFLGEVLSGSTPPAEFLSPIGFTFLVLLYGCGTLLIREAKARWGLQWSVIFLAAAYGILEEGTMIQSFFNTSHADLGVLSGYGMYFGVQWVWAIMLIFFHGTISTLIPIQITELLWSEYKNKPILTKKQLLFCLFGFSSVIFLGMLIAIEQKSNPAYADYHPDFLLISANTLVALLFIWLAYKYKDSKITKRKAPLAPPLVFGIGGFMFQAINLLLPNIFANRRISEGTTILTQGIFAVLAFLFVFYQIYHQNISKRHIVYLIFGSLLFSILLSPVIETSNSINGLTLLGAFCLLLLIAWSRIVLKN